MSGARAGVLEVFERHRGYKILGFWGLGIELLGFGAFGLEFRVWGIGDWGMVFVDLELDMLLRVDTLRRC